MAHQHASFAGIPQLFVVLDEPDPSLRRAVQDAVLGANVSYCMTRAADRP